VHAINYVKSYTPANVVSYVAAHTPRTLCPGVRSCVGRSSDPFLPLWSSVLLSEGSRVQEEDLSDDGRGQGRCRCICMFMCMCMCGYALYQVLPTYHTHTTPPPSTYTQIDVGNTAVVAADNDDYSDDGD